MKEKEREPYTEGCHNQVKKASLSSDSHGVDATSSWMRKLAEHVCIHKNKKNASLVVVDGALCWNNFSVHKMPLSKVWSLLVYMVSQNMATNFCNTVSQTDKFLE